MQVEQELKLLMWELLCGECIQLERHVELSMEYTTETSSNLSSSISKILTMTSLGDENDLIQKNIIEKDQIHD